MNHVPFLESCWTDFLEEIQNEFGKETVDRWLRSLKANSSNTTLLLEAKDSFQLLWIEEHILPQLRAFLSKKEPNATITLSLEGEKKKESKVKEKRPVPIQKKKTSSFQLYFPDLDPTASFEHFIKHQENEVPLRIIDEICSSIIQKKLKTLSSIHTSSLQDELFIPNPVYIYGPPGCGKTHLLQAIANKLRKAGIKALYANADLFTEHVVKSMRASEMTYFRQLWRNADALLIDDVHLFAKKSATQEEFFHTFNTLHVANKSIFLASNCTTQQLQFIEPRLVSRFDWGISLPLAPLPQKMYKTLLEEKAKAFHFPLSSKMSELLISLFPSSPKAVAKGLEATILRTTLPSNKTKEALSTNQLRALLKDLIEEEAQTALTFEKILSATAQVYGVTEADLIGKSQAREYVMPRQIAMYLARKHLKMPYMKIGDRFFRDHSTVMSGIRQIEKQLKEATGDLSSTISSIEILLQKCF